VGQAKGCSWEGGLAPSGSTSLGGITKEAVQERSPSQACGGLATAPLALIGSVRHSASPVQVICEFGVEGTS